MLPLVGIQLKIGGFNSIKRDILHFGVYHLAEIKFSLAVSGVHISLELIVGHFITLFVPSISLAIFLNGIVCQVNHLISNVLNVVLKG